MSYYLPLKRASLFAISSLSLQNFHLVSNCDSKETPIENETTFNSFDEIEFKRFRENRIIHINSSINKELAVSIKNCLEQLDNEKNLPIKIIINSNGGEVTQGLSICDKMNKLKSEVHTQCDGVCASIASVILANGTEGKRTITPNSTVYIHEPYNSFGEDMTLTIFELNGLLRSLKIQREQIINTLIKVTRKSRSEIEELMKNDTWLTSQEAIEHQLVDSIEK